MQIDSNGNMIKDLNKGITNITYNYLNLPERITFNGNQYITYLYGADGTKLQKSIRDAKNVGSSLQNVYYLGGFQYFENMAETGDGPNSQGIKLEFFPQAEGYVKYTDKGKLYSYVYNYTDDNGDGSLKILEESNYYPFGLKHTGYNGSFNIISIGGNAGKYNYKYNGKELQEELNLNLYDYGARNYDPALGRWFNMDPLAEKHPDLNPMTYVNNNPIRFIDPDGMDWVEAANGDITWRDDVTAKNNKDKGVLQEGETYRGTYYERTKTWDNEKHKGLVLETYHTYKKMDYSTAKEMNIEIDGEMRNSKIGDVDIKLNVTFGNGAPENGEYTVDNYQDRSPTGWYNKGMNKDGVGFSYNLNPQFSTGRTLLRIHPDGNKEGTLGCIGMSGDKIILTNFSSTLNSMIKTGGSVPVNINIKNNPNNNGRSGAKIPNVNE